MSKKLNKKNLKSAKGGTVHEIYAPIAPAILVEGVACGAKAGNRVIPVTKKPQQKKQAIE